MIGRGFYIGIFAMLGLLGLVSSVQAQESLEYKADSLISAASTASAAREYDSSEEHYLKAIELYSSIGAKYKEGVAYYNLARMYYSSYQDSLTLIADDKAIVVFSELDSITQLAMVTNQLGNHMSGIGMNREAISEYEKAIAASRSIGDSLSVGFYQNNLGLVLKDIGEYQKALAALYNSLKLKEDYDGSSHTISSSLLNIGLVLDLLKKPEESLTFYNRAITYKSELGDSLGIARIYANMAVIHKNELRYDSAISFIGLSNEILKFFPDEENLQYVNQTNLGNLFKRKGDFKEAEQYLQSALRIAERLGDKDYVGDTYQSLGGLALEQGDSFLSIDYYLKALGLASETQSYGQMMEIQRHLQEAYAYSGEYKKAHQSAMFALQYRDSVYRMEQIKASEEMQTRYETEKKEQQILFQESELKSKEVQLERNQILNLSLVAISILLVVIIILARNRSQKKQILIRQEGELNLREAEINAVINSQEKERNRFAKDLHDGFGQMISVLKMNLGQLGTSKGNPEKQLEVFEQSEEVIGEMYTELRNICFDLMPQTLVQSGLQEALKEFGHRVSGSGSITLEVLIFDLEERLNELTEISLYRISQEWVNNILKYSDADQITLQLTRDEEELTLTIEDNGKGFNPEDFFSGKGNGWRNIQSRVNLMKGEFELDSRAGVKGTMISVNVPVTKTDTIPTSTDEKIAV